MSVVGKAVRGAIWNLGGSIGARIVGVIGTLVLTHFLDPDVTGEVTVASVVVLSANYLSSWGLGQYVVSKPKAGRAAVWHATVYHVVGGTIVLALLIPLAWPLAPLFRSPGIAIYMPGLVVAGVLDRLSAIPERVLVRDMHFRAIATTRALGEVTYAVSTVAFAAAGLGAMSIVWGTMARSALRVVVFLAAAPRAEWATPSKLDRAVTRDLFRFGWPIWVGGMTNFASQRWGNLLIASFFGPGQAGLYNLAYNLADIPATQVGESIGDVLLPAFARMEQAERQKALVRSTALLALIIFPLAVGLGAIADPLVRALFNEQWQGIAPLLVVLSVLSIVRPISWTINAYLFAEHRTRTIMFIEVGKTVVFLGAVSGLAVLGATWACVGVGVAFSVAAVASVLALRRSARISPRAFLPGFIGPALACVPMAAAVLGVSWLFDRFELKRPVVETGVCIIAGAIVYVPSALIFARKTSRECMKFAKEALRRRRGGGDDEQKPDSRDVAAI